MTNATQASLSCQIDTLTEINLDDLVSSFGWEGRRLLAWALRRLCFASAREFARQMLEYDEAVGVPNALAEASGALLRKHYVRHLKVEGMAHRPSTGPALFVANHPGLTDTLSLFAAIGRPDLKIIATHRPFLEALQNVAAHICFVDGNLGRRVIAAHEVAHHLRRGGAALTFPAGRIEPDPDLDATALNVVERWTDSARVIARMVPEVNIIPTLVRGVVCRKSARHWLARLKREPVEREKLSAALQLVAMVSRGTRPTTVTVRFAPGIMPGKGIPPEGVHREILARMREMIAEARPS